uniref:Putative secreted protein n=1 Tax=Ixodes ricinus TaxID=34613 RepID=A0A6B0UVH8_IXORI
MGGGVVYLRWLLYGVNTAAGARAADGRKWDPEERVVIESGRGGPIVPRMRALLTQIVHEFADFVTGPVRVADDEESPSVCLRVALTLAWKTRRCLTPSTGPGMRRSVASSRKFEEHLGEGGTLSLKWISGIPQADNRIHRHLDCRNDSALMG